MSKHSKNAQNILLITALEQGLAYSAVFAGQGVAWQNQLRQYLQGSLGPRLRQVIQDSQELLAPVAGQLALTGPSLKDFLDLPGDQGASQRAFLSIPGITLTQLGAIEELADLGFRLGSGDFRGALGHSQGVLGARVAQAWVAGDKAEIAQIVAIAQLIGCAASNIALKENFSSHAKATTMLAVSGLETKIVTQTLLGHKDVTLALHNTSQQNVLSGLAQDLRIVAVELENQASAYNKSLERKERGGMPLDLRLDFLGVEVPFHTKILRPGVDQVVQWAQLCGLDADLAKDLAQKVLTDPVDWPAQLRENQEAGSEAFIDFGPDKILTSLCTTILEGSGAYVASVGTPQLCDEFLVLPASLARSANWADWAPRLLDLAPGEVKNTKSSAESSSKIALDTAFTRLTGRSPILLAGMTPTTVDPEIVAAAAKGGHWAELAGGGQVTAQVYGENLAKLRRLLPAGRATQFNAMFFDRYLWNLQFGTKKIVTRSRLAGAPLDGVVVSAGIPQLEEAGELLKELKEAGIPYVAFKPGTVPQIRQILAIAQENPDFPVIMQIEDGHAGGHHSWENLDDLLLATYGEIRRKGNIVLAVGGGIGTPEKASRYLLGTWSQDYGRPSMPVDGVLVGTAAMTCLEAKTSREVKSLLLRAPGVGSNAKGADSWVPAGGVRGQVTSGLSHLRADMYEIDNSAAACARVIAEVCDDHQALVERREEVIAALNLTAKPFFGELSEMTYAQWVRRFFELCEPWLDDTWLARFHALLQRVEARLHENQSGEISSIFPSPSSVAEGKTALDRLVQAYPQAQDTLVCATDCAWFPELCRQFPKPLPFVPVIDDDLLRWWGTDSLWQSQESRYSADAVRIIPGPVSVAGIDRIDEPVTELLDRFEAQAAKDLQASGVQASPALSRRAGVGNDPVELLRQAPFISWMGHLITNPARVVEPQRVRIVSNEPQGYTMALSLDTAWDTLRDDVPQPFALRSLNIPLSLAGSDLGGYPIVDPARLSKDMFELLAGVAGVGSKSVNGYEIQSLPNVTPSKDYAFGLVSWAFTPGEELWSKHLAVTGQGLPSTLLADTAPVPDALLGSCWPAIYQALGTGLVENYPVIEGLLNAVHLDHSLSLLPALQDLGSLKSLVGKQIQVKAWIDDLSESASGRIVLVRLDLSCEGKKIIEFAERFAIRGRINSDNPPKLPPSLSGMEIPAEGLKRTLLRRATVNAPADMSAFAYVSGDFNPIHVSKTAAKVAGLSDALVHGMWLSATAQHFLQAKDADSGVPGWQLTSWRYHMYGLVNLRDQVELSLERVAKLPGGGLGLEVTCRVGKEVVSKGEGRVAPARSAYLYPGQGIQAQGMGMKEMASSPAARQLWERADAHTRSALGFSILQVVRDNPKELQAQGQVYRHPSGVLNLTQFTQVALATLALAQSAQLREAQVVAGDAFFAGHSLGEYNALSAFAQVISPETVLELVFHRGQAMHELVERDSQGRSNYALGALRPDQFGIDDSQVEAYVAQVAQESQEFLQIVNYNLAGRQYAVAGTLAGLQALAADANGRAQKAGGKTAFMLVPGVDVPFHSSVLRNGVPGFRQKLIDLLPEDIAWQTLQGRYIPNLVARPFELTQDFVASILQVVPSTDLQPLVDDPQAWQQALAQPAVLARRILIELLCWQFASPVRWIETQDLLLRSREQGGLGVNTLIEVGLGASPTLANLAARTGQDPRYAPVRVLNLQRDAAAVFFTDTPTVLGGEKENTAPEVSSAPPAPPAPALPSGKDGQIQGDAPATAAAQATPVAPATAVNTAAAPAASENSGASGAASDQAPAFSASNAIATLIALAGSINLDQVAASDTSESITNGVSSRRNQLLMDMSSELGLASIDGAATAAFDQLSVTVDRLAHNYAPFGPVLSEALNEALRKLFGPAGQKASRVAQRLSQYWGAGPQWVHHVQAELLLATRPGTSVRGGVLATLGTESPTNAAEVDKLIDAALTQAAKRLNLQVAPLASQAQTGGVVDSAALDAFAAKVTGSDGILASQARDLLNRLGLGSSENFGAQELQAQAEENANLQVLQALDAELGAGWATWVAPVFDEKRIVLLDDRWALAREDLARAYAAFSRDGALDFTPGFFAGAGEAVAQQGEYWLSRLRAENKVAGQDFFTSAITQARAEATTDPRARFAGQVAVVTGAAKGSIGEAVVAKLLEGGAQVIMSASKVDGQRLNFAKTLYRQHAAFNASLWLVPANLSSYRDVDSLCEWIGSKTMRSVGGQSQLVKPALSPCLVFPFAAPPVSGTLAEAGAGSERQMRLLLWSVERLITRLSSLNSKEFSSQPLHAVLPGSPNRGSFGGDGAYGEAKAAFDAIVNKWHSETNWAKRLTLAYPIIGWVRGTGLMGGNDPLVQAAQDSGINTYSTWQIADELLELCTPQAREKAALAPLRADLSGGLSTKTLDFQAIRAASLKEESGKDSKPGEPNETAEPAGSTQNLAAPDTSAIIAALPSPLRPALAQAKDWAPVDARLEDMTVIVGIGEIGPWGSARTRLEAELGIDWRGNVDLTPAGVLELAWGMGLLTWSDTPKSGWYDQEGVLVEETEIFGRFRNQVAARCGVRAFHNDGPLQGGATEEDPTVFLSADVSFTVPTQEEAQSFYDADKERTRIVLLAGDDGDEGEWQVTRLAGSKVRVPRRAALTRTVGGQIPEGFDPTRWGLSPAMVDSLDRMAAWNLVSAVDAFISSGFTPAELLQAVHPTQVSSTQGTGFGGMASMRKLFVDRFLGEARPSDILQEALPNVLAAHVMQSYVGGYGQMIHPVGACATAAVSIEEGVDKIALGKADFVVAGAIDDVSVESLIGFGDMNATAVSADLAAAGISERFYSRANDRRRSGFVEGAGGGTVLLARGSLAAQLGLPVLGVVAYARSFADGAHTSIPAPGLGALGAARGGLDSPLVSSLKSLGVSVDEVTVISKHDTSTNANDPNESELYSRLARALGRTPGNPWLVVSQKTLTGHSKGGAALFQVSGMCQIMASGRVPGNLALDCVDPVMAAWPELVWLHSPLTLPTEVKAGLITSLGFGHVSALLALVHPQAFFQALAGEHGPQALAAYLARAQDRLRSGARRRELAMIGRASLFEAPPAGSPRRFAADQVDAHEAEARMLLDPQARLGADGLY